MYRIGIDLGGTNIAAGIVNDQYEIISEVSLPTQVERPEDAIADTMIRECHMLCEQAGIPAEEIAAVGVAVPGVADNDLGEIGYCCNLPFRHYPLAAKIKADFPVKQVLLENDANAAAWGEAVAGAAKGTTNSVMITLGTGVGGGIIIDGRVYSGFNHAGAELGHMVIQAGGAPCGCGRRGCWEAYSSATGLIRMTKQKIADCAEAGRKTALTEYRDREGQVTGRTAFDAMHAGDEAAREVVDEYLFYLSQGLSNIINIFQPEILSIGGGISNQGDALLDLLLPLIRKEVYGDGFVKPTEIRIAKLRNKAGIIGAATLDMQG